MSDSGNPVDMLLADAAKLQHGPGQIAVLERAVELADSHGDSERAYQARKDLVSAAVFGSRYDLALVAFGRVLAYHDSLSEPDDRELVLLYYRWVAGAAAEFPTISKSQVDSLYDDLARRYIAEGTSLHMFWKSRRTSYLDMGDPKGAARAHAEMNRTPRGGLGDCAACVQNALVHYHARMGADAKALEAARPIFEKGLSCGSVPGSTHGHVLLPLIRSGRHAEAVRHIKVGYPILRGKRRTVDVIAPYLIGLALTANVRKGVELLDAHFGEAVAATSPLERFEFYLAARLFAEQLARRRPKRVDLRIPETVDGLSGPKPTVVDLTEWLDGRLRELATSFDARNGNKTYSKRVRNILKLLDSAQSHPLKG